MSHYPTEHLCKCEDDGLISRSRSVYYQTLVETSASTDFSPLMIHTNYYPVLVCDDCNKEVLENPDNWYDNFVREGEHFTNDLHILLQNLAHWMHLADKDGKLEYRGTTIGNIQDMERLE